MNKTLEELQKEYEENTAKLEQEQRKLRRLENRKSYFESGSRKRAATGSLPVGRRLRASCRR